ncbi:MAG: hypothetical protein AAF664_20090 [Planctomycetota bacterium]
MNDSDTFEASFGDSPDSKLSPDQLSGSQAGELHGSDKSKSGQLKPKRSLLRVWIRRLALLAFMIVGGLVGLSYWAMRQTKQVPEFYRVATTVEMSPVEMTRASEELEAEMETVRRDAEETGSWEAAFSQEQINAWLAHELPEKFPRIKRAGASEPRIALQDEKILAAIRISRGALNAVVSCELKVELTEQPNMIAVRLSHLRAGALPLPLDRFRNAISREASRGGLEIHWDETEEGPIALVSIPSDDPRYRISPTIIEQVTIVENAIFVSGKSGERATMNFQPRGQVHQFVAFQPDLISSEAVGESNKKSITR